MIRRAGEQADVAHLGDVGGARPLRDAITATHDAIDFAKAIVADGGHSTAGLAMLRGEVGVLQRQVAALRQEIAATRSDVSELRADLLKLSGWAHGPLVARLADRFAQIDAQLSRCEARARPEWQGRSEGGSA